MTTRYLAGIVDLPQVTTSGRLVTRPGYDPETKLYLHMPMDWSVNVPEHATETEIRAALKVIAEPYSGYKFTDANSAAGMLSGILAAISRPVLDLCPAYLFDAAAQGSGKTLAATSLGAIIEGERVGVTPFSGSGTDDELRKRFVSCAIAGSRFVCIDNITGHFSSSVLAAVLTSGKLSDRILGQSRMVDVRIRSLVTLSSNNSSCSADLMRRTVHCRIHSGSNPTHRAFAFNPVTVALARRRQIAEAVCLLQRAYFAAGAPDIIAGDAGGFSDWNRLCRQPILWLAQQEYSDALPWSIEGGDPAGSMLSDPSLSDPEIEATGDLLSALWTLSDGKDFTSADVLTWQGLGRDDSDGALCELRSAITECVGKHDITARGIGRVLAYRRERVVCGLKLLVRASGRLKSWRVVLAD